MDKKTLENLLKDCGVTLYDTESVTEHEKKFYRIFITADEPIKLDKCAEITRIISPILDLDPPIDGEYFLEVSSPGIDRSLIKIDHFKKSINDLVKIKLEDGSKLKAKILKVTGNTITVYDKADKEDKDVNFVDIVKAKTYFEW